jgi:hypothetical protein
MRRVLTTITLEGVAVGAFDLTGAGAAVDYNGLTLGPGADSAAY